MMKKPRDEGPDEIDQELDRYNKVLQRILLLSLAELTSLVSMSSK